jgi:hypothetical protein
MADWNKYGALGSVVITAGAVITGVLWYDRASSQIRAEDYAELLAAKWERGMVFQDEQSAPYEWNAGTVSLRVVKSKIEAAVDGLVKYVTDECDTKFTHFYEGKVLWLDPEYPLPADGGTVVVYNASWYTAPVYSGGDATWWWRTLNHTAKCTAFRTLNTRAAQFGPPFLNVPGHTNTLVPAAHIFEGTEDGAAGSGPYLADNQQAFFWGNMGAWWYYAGLGTNVFVMPHDVIYPVRTNVLSDARALARKMTRTAVWYEHPTTWTSASNYYGFVEEGFASSFTARYDNVTSPSESAFRALLCGLAESNVETNGNISKRIASANIETFVKHLWPDAANTDPEMEGYGEWEVIASAGCRRQKQYNLMPPYPSQQAIASGMVSRVRIYLFARHDLAAWPMGFSDFVGAMNSGGWIKSPPPYHQELMLTDYTLDSTKPQSYAGENLGTGLHISLVPPITNAIAFLGPDETYANYHTYVSGHPSTVLASLVYDSGEIGPVTERPVFDLVADFALPDIAPKQYVYEWLTVSPGGMATNRYHYTYEARLYDNEIMLKGALIVVDWNFKHLVDVPYEPEPHTPEWLSTNAP